MSSSRSRSMTSLLNTAMCINKKPHPNLHMRQVGLAYNTVFVCWLAQLTALSLYTGWISLQHCFCMLQQILKLRIFCKGKMQCCVCVTRKKNVQKHDHVFQTVSLFPVLASDCKRTGSVNCTPTHTHSMQVGQTRDTTSYHHRTEHSCQTNFST